jgi:hypothetical protein
MPIAMRRSTRRASGRRALQRNSTSSEAAGLAAHRRLAQHCAARPDSGRQSTDIGARGGSMNAINHVAVWAAGIVQFLLGAGWYTLLGPAWMAGIGKTEAQLVAEHGQSPLPYIIALGAALVVAYAIAWLLPRLGTPSAGSGARAGAVLALALIASTLAMNYGFEARPLSLWLINAGYMVVGMTILGAIIGHWRKKA